MYTVSVRHIPALILAAACSAFDCRQRVRVSKRLRRRRVYSDDEWRDDSALRVHGLPLSVTTSRRCVVNTWTTVVPGRPDGVRPSKTHRRPGAVAAARHPGDVTRARRTRSEERSASSQHRLAAPANRRAATTTATAAAVADRRRVRHQPATASGTESRRAVQHQRRPQCSSAGRPVCCHPICKSVFQPGLTRGLVRIG